MLLTCGNWAVFSQNFTTYINVNVDVGYNLITLPLQSAYPTSSINSVLTNSAPALIPFGAEVILWDPVHQQYEQPLFAGGDGNWYTAAGEDLATNSIPPGMGFFFFLPTVANQKVQNGYGYTNYSLTIFGTILQGAHSISVNIGYGFYGNFEPVAWDITTNGFPVSDGSLLYTWTGTNFSQPLFGLGTNDSGYDLSNNLTGNPYIYPAFTTSAELARVVFAPAVGQGFVYFNRGPAATWTQNFTVQ